MNKILPAILFSGTLALLGPNKAFGNEKISTNSDEITEKVTQILSLDKEYSKIIDEKLSKLEIDEGIKQEIRELFQDKTFQKEIFKILKQEFNWSIENILSAIILGFLYGYAYYGTVKKVKKDSMEIVVKSFVTFSLTSGGMVFVNGFVPGSLVYFESFLLAGYVVYLHLKNKREGRVQKFANFSEFIDKNPLPVVRYDKNGKPILWNKKMEEETGYNYNKILEYYEKKGEVMTLLYKGYNLEKVEEYLSKIKKTGIGYKNIAFTMTTKYGEEKTFLWTTMPDGIGGTIRTARLLTDENEIKDELKRTKDLLNNTYNEINTKDDIEMLAKIDDAIINNKIIPFYQPIYHTNDTSKIYKYEVLMRIKNNDGTFESPLRYLEVAKKYNRLVAIFNVILNKVFLKASENDLKFSINISGQDMSNPDLISILMAGIEKYGIDPSRITLEILEGEWNKDFDHFDIITKIKSKKFRIAMDDFGSDNSNLNRLLDLLNNKQIDELKIDGHIIKYLIDKEKGIENDDKNIKLSILTKEILRGVINACHKVGILIIAEYIENEEILNECKSLGIDYLQGFYLSKPLENIK